jgi:hypothetical protein
MYKTEPCEKKEVVTAHQAFSIYLPKGTRSVMKKANEASDFWEEKLVAVEEEINGQKIVVDYEFTEEAEKEAEEGFLMTDDVKNMTHQAFKNAFTTGLWKAKYAGNAASMDEKVEKAEEVKVKVEEEKPDPKDDGGEVEPKAEAVEAEEVTTGRT